MTKRGKRKKVTCYCDKQYMDMVEMYDAPPTFWIKAYQPQGLIVNKNFVKITFTEL